MKYLLTLIALAFIIHNIQAQDLFNQPEYRIGLFKDKTLDKEKVVHIILVGSANKEDSDQFFQSGKARAKRLKELYPAEQVVFMSSPEVKNISDAEVFAEFGINVVKTVKSKFTDKKFLKELSEFKKIASLDYYGHSTPWAIKLEKNASFNPDDFKDELPDLKHNFTADAYINLSGCNTGFTIAPALSAALEIPVSGALTSMVFERIESDGKWYKEVDSHPEGYVRENVTSFIEAGKCDNGYCDRMKPIRHNYASYWGVFEGGGLSFQKFFCHFSSKNKKCERGMAKSIISFPSVTPISDKSSVEDFKKVAFDWLCSSRKDPSYYEACSSGILAAIDRGDFVFKTHAENELVCDFKSCNAKIICKGKIFGGNRPDSCKNEAKTNDKPTNAAKEFVSFVEGFKSLQGL